MVFASVQMDNLNKMEYATTTQPVKMEQNGMVNNVLEFHVFQVLHIQVDADVAKPQFMLVLLELIGTVQDVSM